MSASAQTCVCLLESLRIKLPLPRVLINSSLFILSAGRGTGAAVPLFILSAGRGRDAAGASSPYQAAVGVAVDPAVCSFIPSDGTQ
jgi:hypothetical protein